MRRPARKYTGSALLQAASTRLAFTAIIIVVMWLLSGWALGWLWL